jgi:hypothetical protein
MAVSFVSSAKASTRADGDPVGITVTHGFTLADGDVLYAFLTRSDDAGTAWTGSGSTWAEITNLASTAANDMLSTVLRRVIVTAAGEPSSYTFVTSATSGTNQQVAILIQTRGADTTTPEEVLQVLVYSTNDFTPGRMLSDATVSENDSLVLCFHAACMNDGVSGKTGGAPSGMTLAEYDEEIFAGQVGSFAEAAYEARNAGTFTANVDWTGSPGDSTSEFQVAAVAVMPAAADAEIDAQDGAYAVTGTAATVIAARMVSSDPGTYTYTGVLASLLTTRLVSSDPGVYAITGFDTDLVYVPATGDFELNAATGTYSLTGSAATVVAGYALDGDPAGYTLTGYDLDFGQERIPILPAGEPGIVADYGRGRIREQVLV